MTSIGHSFSKKNSSFLASGNHPFIGRRTPIETAQGISAQVFFPMLSIAMENLGVSRRKCPSPVDPHVQHLGSSSISCLIHIIRHLSGSSRYVSGESESEVLSEAIQKQVSRRCHSPVVSSIVSINTLNMDARVENKMSDVILFDGSSDRILGYWELVDMICQVDQLRYSRCRYFIARYVNHCLQAVLTAKKNQGPLDR